jgi:hypothetical protein
MNEETSKDGLTLIKHCQGYFGDHHVDGKWLEDRNGERSWLMKLVSAHVWGSFWVTGKEFRSALMNVELSGKAPIGTGKIVTDLDQDIEKVMLNAIQEWEGEPASS